MYCDTFRASSSFLMPIIQAVEARGLRLNDYLDMSDQAINSVAIPGNFISVAKLDNLVNHLISSENDPDFIIDIAKNIQPMTFLGLGHVVMSAANVKESLDYLIEYHDLITNISSLKFIEDEEYFSIKYIPHTTPGSPSGLSVNSQLTYIACLIQLLRMITHQGFSPEIISLNSNSSDNVTSKFKSFLNCEFTHSTDEMIISFDKEKCLKPLISSNPTFLHTHKTLLNEQYALLNKLDIITLVEKQIRIELPQGELSQCKVANNLNMSLRNLQRKLQSSGTSYRDIIDKTRKEMAYKYICEKGISLGEISYLCGFSSLSNFNRAFKRWFNFPPTVLRKKIIHEKFIDS